MSNSSLAIPLSPVCPSVENAGRSAPIGATVGPGGVNFSIFSRYATAVELLFFDRDDDARPARVIPFDPAANRTYHYWHTFVPGAQPGQLYGYRVYGPFDPPRGLRFDPGKVLLDPYGRSVVVPKQLQPRSRARRRRQCLHRDEERRGRSARIRLGGRHAALPASHTHHHLRDARARLHAPSQFRAARKPTRHLRRRDRENSLFDGARHYGRGTHAGLPVRRAGCSVRIAPTTGATRRSRSLRRTRITVRAATRQAL